jgi:hypothetical protein
VRSDQRANRHSRVQPEVLPTRKLQGESIFRIFGASVKLRFIPPSRLALETFSYRARLSVGAYLAAVGNAEAVLFGGGIGEDSPWFREAVCAGLGGWGVELDITANRSTTGMSVTTEASRLHTWAMPVEEGCRSPMSVCNPLKRREYDGIYRSPAAQSLFS